MTAAKRFRTVLVVAALSAVATAASAGEPSRADALFKQGRTLLDAKRYEEACPKLAESQKLEPGAGTLLALALCHEGQGKTATAHAELLKAAELGEANGRKDLAGAAQKRARAMEPSLPKLTVRSEARDASEYEIRLDGEAQLALAKATPVDPGAHKVDVSAKGRVSRTYTVRLVAAGKAEIKIDALEREPVAAVVPVPAAVPASAPATPASTVASPLATEPPETPIGNEGNRGGAQRAIGVVVASAGIVGLGAGTYFAIRGASESAEGRNSQNNDANDRSKSSFTLGVVSVAAGTGALALGAILYFTAPRSNPAGSASQSRTTAQIVPEAGPNQAGVGVVGTF